MALAPLSPTSPPIGEDMIHRLVHAFYGRVRADADLGPIFDRVIGQEWDAHLAKMCDFWSSVLLRTSRYQGRPLPPHLALPDVGEEHFRRWLTLFRATVEHRCPPQVAALFFERALRIAHSFRLAIAFNRGENSMGVHPILADTL